MRAGKTLGADFVITEIGGTVGDIESQPFLEAIRQMKSEVGDENVVYIHTTLVPYLKAAHEMKTKPTQHSVRELRSIGIQPNILVVRTEQPITDAMRQKIALFCDVKPSAVVESRDVPTIYSIPLRLQEQGFDQLVLDHFKVNAPKADMQDWSKMVDHMQNLKRTIKIALVGKYVALHDAYISVDEALQHAGYPVDAKIDLDMIDAEKITPDNVADLLGNVDGIIVPGGFGDRGIEGMITAIRYAREQDVPFLGICLGMQVASIEFARDVLGYKDANSTEMDPDTQHKIIDLMADQADVHEMGGTQRLGLYPCKLKPGSVAAAAYDNQDIIQERHRHRYEFNNQYRAEMAAKGLVFSGTSPDDHLVEVIELPNKKFFVAAQYHPEFLSRPNRPEGLFRDFVAVASQTAKN